MATSITTIAGLQAISDDLTADYELANDLEGSGVAFTPLGTFTGTLDGQGYKVKNLTITISAAGTQYGALITTNEGEITNLGLEDCAISVTATGTSARVYAAGMFITNTGSVYDSYVTGTITSISTGSTSSYFSEIGGLGTWNLGNVIRCYSTATVTSTGGNYALGGGLLAAQGGSAGLSKCYSTGDVTVTAIKRAAVGGFIENVTSSNGVCDSYARGDASASGGDTYNYGAGFIRDLDDTASRCYSTGAPTGASGIGGFCQDDSDGTATGCFWDTTTSGTASSDGGTGKTTAQMKTESTFTDADWNFIDIWDILSTVNDGYPYLLGIARPPYTTPVIYDPNGRIPKGARVQARRNDTGYIVETQTLGSNGKATFTNLPNDVGVTFQATWGGMASDDKSQLLYSTIIGVSEGGTGSSDAPTARTNLGLGTGASPQFTAINLGHATDTTIARVDAGRISVEGKVLTRCAAQVISANDSYIKTQADAICDGTDD